MCGTSASSSVSLGGRGGAGTNTEMENSRELPKVPSGRTSLTTNQKLTVRSRVTVIDPENQPPSPGPPGPNVNPPGNGLVEREYRIKSPSASENALGGNHRSVCSPLVRGSHSTPWNTGKLLVCV